MSIRNSLTHILKTLQFSAMSLQSYFFVVITLSLHLNASFAQDFNKIEFHIKEQQPSGTEVGSILRAARLDQDQEVEPNELYSLRYSFLNQNPNQAEDTTSLFSVKQETGIIYTTVMIDRERICELRKTCSVEFEVTVTSKRSSLFKIIEVRIDIEDINDNSPRFPRDEVTLFVPESFSVNKELTIVGATDKDTDADNSVYDYQLISDYPDLFSLKPERKLDMTWDLRLVLLSKLDRERQDHYVLTIIAKDNGIPQRSGSVKVHINVTDDNDNKPVFSENIYYIKVLEKAEIGTVVGQVNATDADRGMNAALTYRFSPSKSAEVKDLFYIDSQSGEIKVKKELQYEAGKEFETVVEASDRGNPPQVFLLCSL